MVADTVTSWEVEREVTQVMIYKLLLCYHMLSKFKGSVHRKYKKIKHIFLITPSGVLPCREFWFHVPKF